MTFRKNLAIIFSTLHLSNRFRKDLTIAHTKCAINQVPKDDDALESDLDRR